MYGERGRKREERVTKYISPTQQSSTQRKRIKENNLYATKEGEEKTIPTSRRLNSSLFVCLRL